MALQGLCAQATPRGYQRGSSAYALCNLKGEPDPSSELLYTDQWLRHQNVNRRDIFKRKKAMQMGHLWSSSVNYPLTSLGITLPLKDRQNIFKFIPFHGFYHLSCLHTLWCIPPDLNSLHFSASVPQFCHVFFQTSVFSFFFFPLFSLLSVLASWLQKLISVIGCPISLLKHVWTDKWCIASLPEWLICSHLFRTDFTWAVLLGSQGKIAIALGKCLIFALTKQCKLFLILFTLPLQYYVCKKRKKNIRPPKGRMNQLSEAVYH